MWDINRSRLSLTLKGRVEMRSFIIGEFFMLEFRMQSNMFCPHCNTPFSPSNSYTRTLSHRKLKRKKRKVRVKGRNIASLVKGRYLHYVVSVSLSYAKAVVVCCKVNFSELQMSPIFVHFYRWSIASYVWSLQSSVDITCLCPLGDSPVPLSLSIPPTAPLQLIGREGMLI